jgi:hypothetical protein
MSELSTPENDSYFYLVTLFEKPHRILDLELKIVFISPRSHTDALEFGHPLLFLRIPFSLALFVTVLPVIHYATDRRIGVSSHFYKIQSTASRVVKRFTHRHYTDLTADLVDKPDLASANALIYLEVFEYGPITSYNARQTRQQPTGFRHTAFSIPNKYPSCQFQEDEDADAAIFRAQVRHYAV